MAPKTGFIVPTVMVAHPYRKLRDIQPDITVCETCNDRKIMTKDWTAHKNSKRHRQNEESLKVKEEVTKSGENTNGNVGADSVWGDDQNDSWNRAATDTQENGWGGGDGSAGWSSSLKYNVADNRRGGGGGGGGGGSCYGCGETGHQKKDCPKAARRGCFNCGSLDHNKADCDQPPTSGGGGDGRACHNCGMTGHIKANCPQDPKPHGGGGAGVCFNCFEGHRKSECTNEKVLKCRNCDEIGHESRECPKPKDWSRVKCNNCNEMGHTVKRCKKPVPEDGGDWNNGSGADQAATGGWDAVGDADATTSGGEWAVSGAAAEGTDSWADTNGAAGDDWGGSGSAGW